MTVVQTDGNDVEPVTVDEFRISVAETYDVIVQPKADRAYMIFAQAEDRTGYARGTFAPRPGMSAATPPMDPRPLRTMTDMGMGGMDHGLMPGMSPDHGSMSGMQMDHGSMPGMQMSSEAKKLEGTVGVDNIAEMPTERLNTPGEGIPRGRRVLAYADLRAARPSTDPRPPSRDIALHLTGNMERFM
jgi:FtsP/CotA-like multicopper oxidase with cupredoxin domain